jgi:hypothetical protein
MPSWFALFELFTAAVASALWYLFPGLGPWPLAVGLVPWVWRLVRTGKPVRLTGFEVPLFLFVMTAAAAVWAAPDRAAAWATFWLIVGGVLLFYGFVGIGDRGLGMGEEGTGEKMQGGEVGAWVLAGIGAGITVYFLATHDWGQLRVKIAAVEQLGRALQAPLPVLPGDRLHPNVVAGLLAFATPFAAAVTLRRTRVPAGRGRKIVGAGLLAVILFGLVMTVSRGAWLALGGAAAAGFVWYGLGLVVRQPRRRVGVMIALVAAAFVALLLVAVLRPEVVRAAIDQLPGGGGLARWTLYRDGWALAQDYPLIGAGLGNYMMVNTTYQLLLHVGFSTHAHNLLLDVAIAQGGVAAALLVVMWGVMVLGWMADVANGQAEGETSPWLGAALLALVTVIAHGLVDDAFYGSRLVVLLFVPLAFAVPAIKRAGWALRLNLGVAGLALAGLMIAALMPGVRADALANLGAVEQGWAELSLYAWPEWRLQDEVRRAVDLAPAIARYEQALALDADDFSANRRMGQIALSLGDYEAALDYLARAYAALPWDHATRQQYGEALIADGQVEAGAALWATVNNGQNQLRAREFWYEYIGDEERLAAVRRALPE